MDLIFLLGRILFAALFINSGVFGHLGAGGRQAQKYAKSAGAPSPELLVPLSGIAIILAGVMLILGLFGDLATLIILGFLIPTTAIMHAFWKFDDPQERQMQMVHFMKNVSLIGAALIIFWLFAEAEDPPLTLTDSLF
jgi:putative oxidoreductase